MIFTTKQMNRMEKNVNLYLDEVEYLSKKDFKNEVEIVLESVCESYQSVIDKIRGNKSKIASIISKHRKAICKTINLIFPIIKGVMILFNTFEKTCNAILKDFKKLDIM